jgi:hypothetical protein
VKNNKFDFIGGNEISKEDIEKAMKYSKINDDFL